METGFGDGDGDGDSDGDDDGDGDGDGGGGDGNRKFTMVFPDPARHSCSRKVSFEFLKGTCDAFCLRDEMTSPRHDKERLMH